MTSQRSSEFATPSRDEIVRISQKHVSMMETSDAGDVWVWVGMHHLLLRTIGRRTGKEHKVALPFWRDPDGHRIVVASFAGAPKDHRPHYTDYRSKTERTIPLVRLKELRPA